MKKILFLVLNIYLTSGFCQPYILFQDKFESGTLRNWDLNLPYAGNSSITIDSCITRSHLSKYSCKFYVENLTSINNYPSECVSFEGKPINSCRHLEINAGASNSFAIKGSSIAYEWSLYFDKLPAKRQFVIAQFHTQSSHGGSPTIQIVILKDHRLQVSAKPWELDEDGDRILRTDKPSLKLLYKTKKINFGISESLREKEWYDFKLSVDWSHWSEKEPKGSVHLSICDEKGNIQHISSSRPFNTMNSINQRLQLGAYWGGKGPSECVFYIDEVTVRKVK